MILIRWEKSQLEQNVNEWATSQNWIGPDFGMLPNVTNWDAAQRHKLGCCPTSQIGMLPNVTNWDAALRFSLGSVPTTYAGITCSQEQAQ